MSLQQIIFTVSIALCLSDNRQTKQSLWDDEVCGATDLKVEKINKEDQVIKFSWKGLKDNNPIGVNYELACSLTKLSFTSDLPFSCDTTDLATLENRTITWKYFFTDTDQYCAIKAVQYSRISNIVKVRTPSEFEEQLTIKGELIIGFVVAGIITTLCSIILCLFLRRRYRHGVVFAGVPRPMYSYQNYNSIIATTRLPCYDTERWPYQAAP